MKGIKEEKKVLSTNQFPVVGIGASAGGLEAFSILLKSIPSESGMAYVLVQHLDPTHESLLPEILQKVTTIPVLEITDDIRVEPDHIYIIPSNKILQANNGVLLLSPRPGKTENSRTLPIDLFFTSLAEIHQSFAIGVVLSGTGSDGTLGLKAIKAQGGLTFAQDGVSAAYDGMPSSAVHAGVVDFILNPDKIPEKILEVTRNIYSLDEGSDRSGKQDDPAFKQILSLLRIRKGTDFTYYKQTTIRRRIFRRIALNSIEDPQSYLKFLRGTIVEQDALYQDLLIPVTSFFRDKKIFENLCDFVFPEILKSKNPGEPIRLWVAGCSTGQEAYSMAICFKEFLGERPERVQIFATDISEPAILKARTGIYTKSEADLSTFRLQEFFTKIHGGYQVKKEIRDMCVFAVHNFLKDPPFGKIDLVSCRNVLIYMEPYLQKKALTTFHYSLLPKKFLLLGKSETSGSTPDLYTPHKKSDKLFVRKEGPARFMHTTTLRKEANMDEHTSDAKTSNIEHDLKRTADNIMLKKYSPGGVVVNEQMDIVHFRGNTENYLTPAPGKPTHNLLKMARGPLSFELRNLLHKVKKENKSVIKENIPIKVKGENKMISIEAFPLPDIIEPHYLILFHDNSTALKTGKIKTSTKSQSLKKSENASRILQLENELEQVREDMRSITEVQEAANEELQSANEELLSGSEELQSLNEELETSKEELQTTNEELLVLNQELLSLNDQVTTARNYSESIITTIHAPLIVLDKSLRVKTANNAFYQAFHVNEDETEGALIYNLGNNQWNIPALRELLEEILPQKSRINDFEVKHDFPSIGERIMLINGCEINNDLAKEKLILLVIEDITERKQHEIKEAELLSRFQNLVIHAPVAICILKDKDFKIELANNSFRQIFENNQPVTNIPLFTLLPNLKSQGVEKNLTAVLTTGDPYFANEIKIRLTQNNETHTRYLNCVFEPQKEMDGKVTGIIVIAADVTEQVIQRQKTLADQQTHELELEEKVNQRTKELSVANEKLKEGNKELARMNKELESFTYVSSHDLQEPLRKIQTFSMRILEKEFSVLSEKGKDYLRRMQSAAERMRQLIQDLIAYSKINMDEKTFININLEKIIDEVKLEFKDSILEKNITIESSKFCDLYIIPFQFRQLFNNMVSNSIKFSKPGIPAKIKIDSEIIVAEKNNVHNLVPGKSYCVINFKDNGIGFDPKYKDQILEVFQRLHSQEEYPGTGIGLAIVKRIVENHNGIITATGALGEGATFTIYLPQTQSVRKTVAN